MDNKRHQKFLYVGKVTADGAPSIADGAAFNFDSLATGEIVFVNAKTGLVETNLATATDFYIWQKGSDGRSLVSPKLQYGKYDYINSVKYLATTQKVTHIGSNGTTGSFPYGDSEIFNVTVNIRSGLKSDFANPVKLKAGTTTGTGATEQSVVTSLTRDLGQGALGRDIKVEMISSDDGTACASGIGTLTVTKGSKIIVAATDIDNNSDLAVGRAIRIGTTVTSPIYIIEAIDTTNQTITVHQAYQGATASVTPNTGAEYITAAELTAADFGIQITGADDTDFKRDYRELQITDFDIELSGNGFEDASTALIKQTTALVRSRGDGRSVADLETRTRQSQSDGMNTCTYDYTNDDQKRDAVIAEKYDVINIACKDTSVTSFDSPVSRYVIDVAVPTMNWKVTVPAAVTDAESYSITVDGTAYTYLSASTVGTALADGLIAAMGSSVQFVEDTTGLIIYIQGTTVTVSTATTIDITVAANTAVVYPSWGSTIMVV